MDMSDTDSATTTCHTQIPIKTLGIHWKDISAGDGFRGKENDHMILIKRSRIGNTLILFCFVEWPGNGLREIGHTVHRRLLYGVGRRGSGAED